MLNINFRASITVAWLRPIATQYECAGGAAADDARAQPVITIDQRVRRLHVNNY